MGRRIIPIARKDEEKLIWSAEQCVKDIIGDVVVIVSVGVTVGSVHASHVANDLMCGMRSDDDETKGCVRMQGM